MKLPVISLRRYLTLRCIFCKESRFPTAALVLSIVGILLVIFDPGGLKSAADRDTYGLINRHFWQNYVPKDRGHVTVVEVTNDSLGQLEMTWPLTYWEHARVLSALLEMKPAAVFVDIVFADKREDAGAEHLKEVFRAYGDAGVPLILAQGTAEARMVARDDFAAVAKVVDATLHGNRSAYLTYRLLDDGRDRSAALVLYERLCAAAAGPRPRSCADGTLNIDDFNDPLDVIWDARPPMRTDFTLCDATVMERSFWLFSFGPRQTCPPQPVLPVEQIVNPSAQVEADLPNWITGKAIVYAVTATGTGDKILPPTHNVLSGAFYHSMALENLITFGKDYKRSGSQEFFGAPLDKTIEIVTILTAFSLIWGARVIPETVRQQAHSRSSVRRYVSRMPHYFLIFMIAAGVTVASLLMIVFFYHILNFSPIMFGSLFTLLITGRELGSMAFEHFKTSLCADQGKTMT
jgi:hypothetical protein